MHRDIGRYLYTAFIWFVTISPSLKIRIIRCIENNTHQQVDPWGFEPQASALQTPRSSN